MKSIFLTLCICLFTSISFSAVVVANRKTSAAAAKTDEVFAPLYRQHEVALGLLVPTGNTDSTPGGSKIEYSGLLLAAGYAYGIADFFSIYGVQSYQNTSYSFTNPKRSESRTGIGDTQVGAKGIIPIDKSYLYYDASYKLGLAGKSKYDSVSGESTPISERPVAKFEGGAGVNLEPLSFGGLVAYKLYQDGDSETTSGSTKTVTKYRSGTGLNWKVYGQLDFRWKLGLSYKEEKTDEYNTVSATGITSITTDSTNTYITAYGIYPVTQATELMLSASKIDNKEATTTKYNLYYITATLRLIL